MATGYSDPIELPEFEYGALGSADTPEPVDSIVRSNLKSLRGGIDGFFDTLEKNQNGRLSDSATEGGLEIAAKQIHEAREQLAGCGVELPNMGVNFETTTAGERVHELGRWTYQWFDEAYPWAHV